LTASVVISILNKSFINQLNILITYTVYQL